MNEDDGEHDPLTGQLRQFTPNAGALDRDALIFAAGRASAKKYVGWKALAGALAASQALSLAILWPHPTANIPAATPQGIVARQPDVGGTSESIAQEQPSPSQLSRLRYEFLASGGIPANAQAAGPIAPDGAPLRAGSSFLPSLQN